MTFLLCPSKGDRVCPLISCAFCSSGWNSMITIVEVFVVSIVARIFYRHQHSGTISQPQQQYQQKQHVDNNNEQQRQPSASVVTQQLQLSSLSLTTNCCHDDDNGNGDELMMTLSLRQKAQESDDNDCKQYANVNSEKTLSSCSPDTFHTRMWTVAK